MALISFSSCLAFFPGQGLVPLRRRRFFRLAPDAGRGLAVLYGSCRRADSRHDRPLFHIRRRQRPSAKSDMPARGGCGVRRLVRGWRFSPVFFCRSGILFGGPGTFLVTDMMPEVFLV